MSALSPLPNAAALAIPDFGESLRGGKLIHRGMENLAAVQAGGELRNYQIFQINGISRGLTSSVSLQLILQ
jgi:hypothetical protein